MAAASSSSDAHTNVRRQIKHEFKTEWHCDGPRLTMAINRTNGVGTLGKTSSKLPGIFSEMQWKSFYPYLKVVVADIDVPTNGS